MSVYLVTALLVVAIVLVCWIALGRDLGRKLDTLSIDENNNRRVHDA